MKNILKKTVYIIIILLIIFILLSIFLYFFTRHHLDFQPENKDIDKIIIYGDVRSGYLTHIRIADMIYQEKPDMVIFTGDIASNSRNYIHYMQHTIFEKKLWDNAEYYPVRGNHESTYWLYDAFFDLPNDMSYYSFDRMGMHFIVLDCWNVYAPLEKTQLEWLKNDLEANKNKPISVAMHVPLFTSGKYEPYNEPDLLEFTVYFDLFKENSAWSIFLALLHGIRFDTSIFLTIISPFIVLLLLPVNSQKYHKIIYWLMFPVYAVITIYLVIDAVYFGYVSRHLAGEFAALGNDYEFIYTMAKTYFYMVFIVLAIIAVCGFFWKKFADIKVKDVNISRNSLIKSALYFILIGGIVFIFIRSSFDIKPISTINAFVSGNNALANLTLNGLFTSLRYMTENEAVSKDMYSFYDDRQAHEFILSLKHENCTHPYTEIKRPNIIFILLESWSSYYVDAFSGSNMQLTPNFNRLASNRGGIIFSNHYSPERRSISAIQAILLGIPPMDNIPKLGFGLETIAGSGNLASNLKENGYDTVFIQASKRNSFYLDVIAKSIGFQEYYGMEDIKQILDYPDYKASQFGWDYETYMKLAEVLKNKGKDKPFFAFLFTGTTHIPYAEPNKINVKFPHDINSENGFKNTLVYADWSLGEFIKKIENEEYFKNTIFIFTADHVLGNFEKQEFPDDFKVPLLIWSPSFKGNQKITSSTNHVDLPPTILGLAGLNDNLSEYIGENIFCKDNNSYSIIHTWGSAAIIKNHEWLKHSFKYMLESSPKNMEQDEKDYLSKILLSYYQESYNIMTKGKK